jgi:hypothetical protein
VAKLDLLRRAARRAGGVLEERLLLSGPHSEFRIRRPS